MIVRTSILLLLVAALPIALPGQQPPAPAGEPTRCSKPWTTPFGVPPFGEIKAEHFCRPSRQASRRQRKEIEAIAEQPAPPTFANTHRGAGERRGTAREGEPGLLEPAVVEHERAAAGHQPRGGAAAGGAARRHPAEPGALRAREGGVGRARSAEAAAGAGAAARRDLQGLRPRRREPDAGAEGALPRRSTRELSALGIKFGDNLLHETNGYRLVDRERRPT